jgi:hypothetical protein
MTTEEQIEIPLSKKKMLLTLMGALAFVGLGFWFLISPPQSNHWLFGNSALIFVSGLASILFFGFVAITVFRKSSDNKPGLTINRQGIEDNSSGVSAGLIPWTDIQEVTLSQVMNQKFLMLIVKNPQEYLNKIKNPLKRNAMKMNYKTYGSPISISSNSLQINFDELQRLLSEKLKQYKS